MIIEVAQIFCCLFKINLIYVCFAVDNCDYLLKKIQAAKIILNNF